MKQKTLPCCLFPTTVMLVDDDAIFLKLMQSRLGSNFLLELYSNPNDVLRKLKQLPSSNPIVSRCLSVINDRNPDHELLDINVKGVHEEIYNNARFANISVMLVDYDMPGMNGVELCCQIEDPRIKKVLLTGQADNDVAVQAFNDGVIDKFILKSSPDLDIQLKKIINELQLEYFRNLSLTVMQNLFEENSKGLSFLHDTKFIEFHNKIVSQNKIVEYYLLDYAGSFIMLDNTGKVIWLIVKSSADLERFYEYAKFDNAPEEILQPLLNKTKMPYFHTEKHLVAAPEAWGKLLHPANKVPDADYYYSIITESNVYTLKQGNILSYQGYLDTVS